MKLVVFHIIICFGLINVNNQEINKDVILQANILDINSTSVNLEYLFEVQKNFILDNLTIQNFYYTLNGIEYKNLTINTTKEQIIIKNLLPNREYKILFTLEYDYLALNITNQIVNSKIIEFFTHKANNSVVSSENCEINGKCKSGCYLNNKTQTCEKCPCDVNKSNGECEMMNDILICSSCNLPFVGNLCLDCDIYYYKSIENYCLPCVCNNNTSPYASRHCDDTTGMMIFLSFLIKK